MARLWIAPILAGCVILAGVGEARAEDAPRVVAKGHGALVVALGEGTANAAKPLAREIYRDEALRPMVDDEAARVLAGDKPKEGAAAKLQELASVRSSISASPEDAASLRLLASLGAERQAELVVAVSTDGTRTIARVLRVEGARYEPVELGPTIEPVPGGEPRFSWPGVTTTLHRLAAPAPLLPKKSDSTPSPVPAAPSRTPWYKSAWFWAPLGVVAAAGAAVLIASQVTADEQSTVRLQGTVSP